MENIKRENEEKIKNTEEEFRLKKERIEEELRMEKEKKIKKIEEDAKLEKVLKEKEIKIEQEKEIQEIDDYVEKEILKIYFKRKTQKKGKEFLNEEKGFQLLNEELNNEEKMKKKGINKAKDNEM